jgi:bifunctional DNA-binding transcriptional regulator/antitoxin component of YhaV-PrlF toxin-antitoxin module
VAEPARPYRGPPRAYLERDVEDRGDGRYRLVVREDGSVMLPAEVREAFGIEGRGVVLAQLDGEEFKLHSTATAWRRLDELMAPYRWKEGQPLASEELIAERRTEAARESGD